MVTPVIASVNIKGGVGKTTTSIALALALAEDEEFNNDKPVLIIDLAPLCCMSKYWGLIRINKIDGSRYPITNPELNGHTTEFSSVSDLWLTTLYKNGLSSIEESVVPIPYKTENELIHVLPSHENNMVSIVNLSLYNKSEIIYNLRNWLRSDDIKDNYSCVIIDTPPAKSVLLEAAIISATAVYIPFQAEAQSVSAVYSTFSYIALQSEKRGSDVPLKLLGLLPSMIQNKVLHAGYLKMFRDDCVFGPKLMPFQFDLNIKYPEVFEGYNKIENFSVFKKSNIFIKAQLFALHIVRKLKGF